ncbi:MAG: WD40/YVTN/BNR-like repeat-containing protein [Bacteroidales bacterium]
MTTARLTVLSTLLFILPLAAQTPRQRPSASQTAAPAPAVAGPKVDSVLLSALKPRSIGPAVMGGRVSDIAYDPENPAVFYVGLATGGVMKTSDNGATFDGVFEREPVASIGAVAVAPSDPKVVWVGSGEANDRNSSGWGNGVYRSTDGGGSWTNVGLKNSKAIARIVVHPKDAQTAFVAAVGDLWNPSPERGLYKTTDGGQTWKRVLQAAAPFDSRVGCGDVVIDPTNPDTLYAALYARQRTPWSFVSGPDFTDGKDVGGIFKSTDGGGTWKKLERGLPKATGRIGLAVYAKNPRIVYAVVQSYEGGTSDIDNVLSKTGGVFRSEDGGESWTRTSPLDPRPFYFSQIRVDPENDQRVYVLGFMMHVSEDGGRTFREDRFKNVHADCHALAIDPRLPKRLLLGTDGGIYQSYDLGGHWDFLNRIAAGQYYRISLDGSTPYRICGGLQDNNSWLGPSATRTKAGIINADWINIYGGDGFGCAFDSADSNIVYAESQQAEFYRLDLNSGQIKMLRPAPAEGQVGFRFNWDSPLVASQHHKGTIYLGGNRIFALSDRAEKWKAISPDLSAQEPTKIMTTGSGAETFGVVFTIAESPIKPDLLWAGTDDGKVWVTENEGANWTDLTAGLPSMVKGLWISRLAASHSDPKVAYMAVGGYRSGNYAPLAFRTADGGKTWQSIAANLPPDNPVRFVYEDPANANLLFAGTETGLYLSFDRGGSWVKYPDLPTVRVDDLAIHPREHDMVVATHGRSLYIVDDIRSLEELSVDVQGKDAYLFPPRGVFGYEPLPGDVESEGAAVFRGANPPLGALFTVYVKQFTGDQVKISVASAAGKPVANLTLPGTPGMNRVSWDLKPTKDLLTQYGGEGQKHVPAGDYEVTMSYGAVKQKQRLHVDLAPGLETR